MTKNVENVNKKWDTKTSGATKAYEKNKRSLETKVSTPFHQISPQPTT